MVKTLLEIAEVLPLKGREYNLYSPRNSLKRSYDNSCDCGDCSSDNCDCTPSGDCVCTHCNECGNDD
ncbi:MAG: hypothetical protein PHQ66_02920 [Candidatus Nanoarchaeia archaeon]|nr:hypothetical protein [Candidatus Nanoarchaeia archaeon]MDD5357682.1 hypothetical protein [Candidatus Nanoarchaeia archaeon]MDD5588601.1 hypothetical protein [Candidatus Nanoarchaeia archaeon]